ncbi:MAG: hypothetical protein A3G08_00405 [Candidatus Magasanikbacteria bacterium RIFCSPLOWO2_12_FULL_47_9b]|nr:MAG: hypothetical protein A3I74_04260 [Candidatus Magasanikbacteria bacterium RIFCSPLOWO2_02_FULL_47_16]OGH79371.1 MAG: hypothetical protein A3C10_04795 [Candidatus Magasanikbacteria bacterium RIFCSPHIGHO2_02_FULL_48_18]OGH83523.1 MAG: hypothetical protein A3G08_00405 [Candidatus Magasanikbacteria bacterium RIFCSPLOWO2_12_FULL_47_9b]
MMRGRVFVQNTMVSLGSFFLFLLVLEVIFRIGIPQSGHFYEHDPTLGSRLIPLREGVWRAENNTIPIRINQFGFRGWDAPREKPAGVRRIAVLGDSYVEAFQVSPEAMFSSVLEEALQEDDPTQTYDVLSFGVSGYGTAQEYLLWSNVVKEFSPDVVIVLFTSANDVRNNAFALEGERHKPYFISDANGLQMVPPETPPENLWRRANQFFLRVSHLYRFVILHSKKLPIFQSHLVRGDIPTDYFVYECALSDEWAAAWDVTTQLLRAMHDEVAQLGADFVLVHGTSYAQIHGDEALHAMKEQYPAMEKKCWDFEKPSAMLSELTQKNNIPYLDLLPIFKDTFEKTGQELHLLSDGHWNERGHALAGAEIANFVQSFSWEEHGAVLKNEL